MIHYHGGPIWPETAALRTWAGRHAFVSFARPEQIETAAAVCQSFALDNGAFSFWKDDQTVDDWGPFYAWAERWLAHPACDWAVIPDVIGGTEAENDALVREWPFGPHRGVPVWHLNESIHRLVYLADEWPRVALGSAAAYDASNPAKCLRRLREALPSICDDHMRPRVKLHGLRMLRHELVERVPLASADSTNIARNIRDGRWDGVYAPKSKEARALLMADRIESYQSPDMIEPPPPAMFDLYEYEALGSEVAS